MAYYVDTEGRIFTYRMAGPASIRLTSELVDVKVVHTDQIVRDPDPKGEAFASLESAQVYAEYVKQAGGDLVEAKKMHKRWLDSLLSRRP